MGTQDKDYRVLLKKYEDLQVEYDVLEQDFKSANAYATECKEELEESEENKDSVDKLENRVEDQRLKIESLERECETKCDKIDDLTCKQSELEGEKLHQEWFGLDDRFILSSEKDEIILLLGEVSMVSNGRVIIDTLTTLLGKSQ